MEMEMRYRYIVHYYITYTQQTGLEKQIVLL